MVVSWAILLAFPTPLPRLLALLIVAYFVFVEGYAAVAFAWGALRTEGVTHHRCGSLRRDRPARTGALLAGINRPPGQDRDYHHPARSCSRSCVC
jgi:hypothetical protein